MTNKELDEAIKKREQEQNTNKRIYLENKDILGEKCTFFANLLQIEGQKLLQNPQIKPFIELLDGAVAKISTGNKKINKEISFRWGLFDDPKGESSKEYQFSTELGAENPNYKLISYLIRKGESKLPIIIKIQYSSEQRDDHITFFSSVGLGNVPNELFIPVFEKGIYQYEIDRCRYWRDSRPNSSVYKGDLNKPESLQEATNHLAIFINDKLYKTEG